MATSSNSDFYQACRNNDLNRVKHKLSQIGLDEINRIEITSVGESTALHAASYYGNYEVVKLLLEHGADATITNFARLTAADEAKTRDILCLFRSNMMANDTTNERFGQPRLNHEWIAISPSVVEKAALYRRWLERGSRNMEYSADAIISEYLEKKVRLKKDPHMDKIKALFQLAAKEHDPRYIIQAYTMETEFYRCLNEDLAATTIEILKSNLIFDRLVEEFWNTHGRVAAIIARHPDFHQYSYRGQCYRGIQMTDQQFFHHKAGTRIMTKSFSSCSRIPEKAMYFATNGFDDEAKKYPTMCTYTVINKLSAQDIAKISIYPDEKEVLISPFSVFEIKQITYKPFELPNSDGTTKTIDGREMVLEECEAEKSDCWIM